MAITNIAHVKNSHTTLTFVVYNHNHPEDTQPPYNTLPPGGSYFVHDMWVPWCFNENDFDAVKGAYISLTATGVSFSIWQQNCPDNDGDQVRYSKDGGYHPCGGSERVPNDSVAGGDRDVEITGTTAEDAAIRFDLHPRSGLFW